MGVLAAVVTSSQTASCIMCFLRVFSKSMDSGGRGKLDWRAANSGATGQRCEVVFQSDKSVITGIFEVF